MNSFEKSQSIKILDSYSNLSTIEKGKKAFSIGTISADGKRIKTVNGWEQYRYKSKIKNIANDLEKEGYSHLNDYLDLTKNDNTLNKHEIALISSYTEGLHDHINSNLRLFDDESKKHILSYTEELNKALDKLSNFKGIVYRTQPLDLNKLKSMIGNNVVLKSFTSTTRDIKSLKRKSNDILMIINCKTGKSIEKYSSRKEEKEVLFKTKTRFRVDNIDIQNGKLFLSEI